MNSLFPHVVQCILHNIIERTHMINEFGSPNQSEFPCKKHFENLLFIDYRFLETFLCIDLQQVFFQKNYLPMSDLWDTGRERLIRTRLIRSST